MSMENGAKHIAQFYSYDYDSKKGPVLNLRKFDKLGFVIYNPNSEGLWKEYF